MKHRTLLLSTLVNLKACEGQVNLFKQTFGDSVDITPELCKQHEHNFNFHWAAEHLLSASAWRIYEETRASALKIYEETCAPARKIFDETGDSAWKIYKESIAWKIYKETCATTFANLYIGE